MDEPQLKSEPPAEPNPKPALEPEPDPAPQPQERRGGPRAWLAILLSLLLPGLGQLYAGRRVRAAIWFLLVGLVIGGMALTPRLLGLGGGHSAGFQGLADAFGALVMFLLIEGALAATGLIVWVAQVIDAGFCARWARRGRRGAPPSPAWAIRTVLRRAGDRCPFCHLPLEAADQATATACAGCQARQHAACWEEHAACASCGQRAEGVALANAPARPDPKAQLSRV